MHRALIVTSPQNLLLDQSLVAPPELSQADPWCSGPVSLPQGTTVVAHLLSWLLVAAPGLPSGQEPQRWAAASLLIPNPLAPWDFLALNPMNEAAEWSHSLKQLERAATSCGLQKEPGHTGACAALWL